MCFQSIADITLLMIRLFSLLSKSQFKLTPESFRHKPSSLHHSFHLFFYFLITHFSQDPSSLQVEMAFRRHSLVARAARCYAISHFPSHFTGQSWKILQQCITGSYRCRNSSSDYKVSVNPFFTDFHLYLPALMSPNPICKGTNKSVLPHNTCLRTTL